MYLLPQNMSTLILIDPKFFDIFYQIFFSVFDGNKFFVVVDTVLVTMLQTNANRV